jgi:hypothetical protein
MGRHLASLDSHDSEALDYRPTVVGQGMAPARWQTLDLQEICRVWAGRSYLVHLTRSIQLISWWIVLLRSSERKTRAPPITIKAIVTSRLAGVVQLMHDPTIE